MSGTKALTLREGSLRTWATWIKQLGGRDALRRLAAQPAPSPDVQRKRETLLALLDDPEAADVGIAKLCQMAQFTRRDMAALVAEHDETLGGKVAAVLVQRSLPSVVEDLASRAVNTTVPCPCRYGPTGEPTEKAFVACRQCMGRGYLYREASLDHQEKLLEMGGLLKGKGGGVTVNTQTNLALGAGFFESFVKATDGPSLEIVDAEAIESDRD